MDDIGAPLMLVAYFLVRADFIADSRDVARRTRPPRKRDIRHAMTLLRCCRNAAVFIFHAASARRAPSRALHTSVAVLTMRCRDQPRVLLPFLSPDITPAARAACMQQRRRVLFYYAVRDQYADVQNSRHNASVTTPRLRRHAMFAHQILFHADVAPLLRHMKMPHAPYRAFI